jgi:hypothetical protein
VRVALQYGDYRIIKPIFILKREALVRVALQYGDYRIINCKATLTKAPLFKINIDLMIL